MKRKLFTLLVLLALILNMAACGAGKETTLSGMVVSVEGTRISIVEMDTENMGNMDFAEGEMPKMPEDMENFQGFENFNPEDFEGKLPEGEDFPQWNEGEMPEMPEGMTIPEDGEMPDFSGENGGMIPGFGNFDTDAETKEVDIADAHISVEIDGGKASGSMDDIKAGTFVTVTLNGKGEVTNVLVSAQSFFGAGRRPAN